MKAEGLACGVRADREAVAEPRAAEQPQPPEAEVGGAC